MAALTVWKFPSPTGADDALATLEIALEAGAHQDPRRRHGELAGGQEEAEDPPAHEPGRRWRLRWCVLGSAVRDPLLRPAARHGRGRGRRRPGWLMADVGIDDDFIASVRSKIQPGTSALFVMTSDAVEDKVKDAFAGTNPELISTNLSDEQEAHLRSVFADD